MELSAASYTNIVSVLMTVIVILLTWRILDSLWFKPKKIEKFLRAQGLKGNSYRFMFGDSKEIAQMTREAKSKPIHLKDDIAPRVLPFVHKSVADYGKHPSLLSLSLSHTHRDIHIIKSFDFDF